MKGVELLGQRHQQSASWRSSLSSLLYSTVAATSVWIQSVVIVIYCSMDVM